MADAELESYTRLAARLFDVPIAHIGLSSDDKKWIKAGTGIDIEMCGRSVSFCRHANFEPGMLAAPSLDWRGSPRP